LKNQTHRRSGFTLIEMVLVLIILATIAGLVISQISMLGRTADMAATAKNQQDIANQLGLYFVLQKRMPQNMDSLLEGTGSAAPTGVLAVADRSGGTTGVTELTQGWGFPLAGAQSTNLNPQLVMADLGALVVGAAPATDYSRSFRRLGFDQVLDHLPWTANTSCNDSGRNVRALASGAGNCFVARVASLTNGDPAASVPTNGIMRTIYPNLNGTLPTGVVAVVAVGIGQRSSLVPDTMLSAPVYPGCDGSYYGRYIAYYAVFSNGERAQLVGVSDSYGRFSNYSIKEFNESLPNNGRQG
jgi:prepilin-type N-terminal cleavage/methylation domain-containing protein